MQEQKVFRTVSRYWGRTSGIGIGFGLIVVLMFLLTSAPFQDYFTRRPFALTCLISPAVLTAGYAVFLLWRSRVVIDTDSISITVGLHSYHITWSDIIFVQLLNSKGETNLFIGTQDKSVLASLRFFDEQAIWQLVQKKAPPEALKDTAYECLPEFKAFAEKRKELLTAGTPLKVSFPSLATRIVGVVGILFSAFIAYVILRDEQLLKSLLLPFGIALISAALLIPGWIEVGAAGVTRKDIWGYFYISWEEVERVETNLHQGRFVFVGTNKILAITGVSAWYGQDKYLLLELLGAQIEHQGIELVQTWRATFRATKNCRIERK
ncbi:MAG: hypothetical protein H6667_01235 [Ardenticatenaceae bacterium]|nr:hypothetical protein [Ardenticatenaceae bacterium]MCB9446393.1 hypothetical protein [Ardenticatenaceae bacterium]